jgi:hypothetical protein
MLGGTDGTIKLVELIEENVTETIWIGKMNKISQRVSNDYREAADNIEYRQRDSEIRRLVEALENNPKIRWKDSIKVTMFARYGIIL